MALEAFAEHARRFPDGKLAEERDALQVEALVVRGRVDDAQRKARRFEKSHPRSVFLRHIEQMLADVTDAAPR